MKENLQLQQMVAADLSVKSTVNDFTSQNQATTPVASAYDCGGVAADVYNFSGEVVFWSEESNSLTSSNIGGEPFRVSYSSKNDSLPTSPRVQRTATNTILVVWQTEYSAGDNDIYLEQIDLCP